MRRRPRAMRRGLNAAAPGLEARVLSAALVSNIAISVSHEP